MHGARRAMMRVILSLGFEGVPACGAPLWRLHVLQDFLLHCGIDAKQSAWAGFVSFVLTAHSEGYSVLLSCFLPYADLIEFFTSLLWFGIQRYYLVGC